MNISAELQLSFHSKSDLDSHSVMDTNEFAVLKLLVLWILGEYDRFFLYFSFAERT